GERAGGFAAQTKWCAIDCRQRKDAQKFLRVWIDTRRRDDVQPVGICRRGARRVVKATRRARRRAVGALERILDVDFLARGVVAIRKVAGPFRGGRHHKKLIINAGLGRPALQRKEKEQFVFRALEDIWDVGWSAEAGSIGVEAIRAAGLAA